MEPEAKFSVILVLPECAFFSEIDLRIGVAENAARRAANVPAHGSITTAGNIKELVRHGRAYRTLFARTLLRMLRPPAT